MKYLEIYGIYRYLIFVFFNKKIKVFVFVVSFNISEIKVFYKMYFIYY